jgi:hypothetical protein
MKHITDVLLTDLRHLIADLGTGGGLMSPSIYDTAQVIRYAPPEGGAWPALNWLSAQQQPDGGWGDPSIPRARDVPTLAAILALRTYGARTPEHLAVKRGLSFLHRHSIHWRQLPDDIPVGVELLLPYLLDEAKALDLYIPCEPYAALIRLGERRRSLVARIPLAPGTTLAHSWEALGKTADVTVIDALGSVGHSPAATAAWLHSAAGRDDLADSRAAARRYLTQVENVTGVGIPGVVPTAWPITCFEQAFGLYPLLIGGLLDHPALQEVIQPQIDSLERAMLPNGLGFTDAFIPDGDDTAEALAVLHAAGRTVMPTTMLGFERDSHFYSYPGELQPSLTTTAHATQVLGMLGTPHTQGIAYLLERQAADGRWFGDKWSSSWLYATLQVLMALIDTQYTAAIRRATNAILANQQPDGGWGVPCSVAEETAYAILALRLLARAGLLDDDARLSLRLGERWMLNSYRPFRTDAELLWMAKEAYRPHRIARVFELAATFPSEIPL